MDFPATAVSSTLLLPIHPSTGERLGLTLKNYKITGKIWHLLKENSRSVRVRVLHALIDQNDELVSTVSQKEVNLALPSLTSVWHNLFSN